MSKISLSLLALGLLLTGCQKGLTEKDYEGVWAGSVSMADADIKKSIEKAPGATVDQVKEFLKNIKIDLDLKGDKSYSLGQGAGNIEGTWEYKDQKITLTPTKAGGKTKDEILKINPSAKPQFDPIVLTSDKEGKTLSGSGPASGEMPTPLLTFTKESAAKTTDAPKTDAPKTGAPKTDAPKVESKTTDIPKK